jgi:hypothetical protein
MKAKARVSHLALELADGGHATCADVKQCAAKGVQALIST